MPKLIKQFTKTKFSKDRDIATIRFTTKDEFWVQPFAHVPVIKSERLYKVRTYDYLFRIGIGIILFCIALFLAAAISRSSAVFTVFVAFCYILLVPYGFLFFLSELTVVDKTLLKALIATFEFKYFVGLVLVCFWPAAFDAMARSGTNNSEIAIAFLVVLMAPIPFIWVAIHDASIRRFAGPTSAIVGLLAVVMTVFYIVLIGAVPAFNGFFSSTAFCIPPGQPIERQSCSDILETFSKPVVMQLIIFFIKYIKHLITSPTTKMMLIAHLEQENRKEDVEDFKHLQDVTSTAVLDPKTGKPVVESSDEKAATIEEAQMYAGSTNPMQAGAQQQSPISPQYTGGHMAAQMPQGQNLGPYQQQQPIQPVPSGSGYAPAIPMQPVRTGQGFQPPRPPLPPNHQV